MNYLIWRATMISENGDTMESERRCDHMKFKITVHYCATSERICPRSYNDVDMTIEFIEHLYPGSGIYIPTGYHCSGCRNGACEHDKTCSAKLEAEDDVQNGIF